MSRFHRILLELFGPSLIGGALFTVIGIIGSGEWVGPVMILKGVLVFAFFGLIFCGVQSICYTILMEIAFSRGLAPRTWQALVFSTVLGLMSGASLSLYRSTGIRPSNLLFFSAIGAVVGFAIALILYFRVPIKESIKESPEAEPGATDNPDDAQRLREDH